MKLLICTQKVDINDDLLGFFHFWIAEFAKNCEQVTVICLYKGEYDLPDNVRVLSLGKEKRNHESCPTSLKLRGVKIMNQGIAKLSYFFNFYKYIFKYKNDYDSVFVHMNSVYVLLGGLFWQMRQKKVGLWYAHGHISWELKVAEKFVDNIFTASKESARLESKKIKIIGHGIDISKFKNKNLKRKTNKFKIIYVGRISKIKNQELLARALNILVNENNIKNIKVDLIGSPARLKDIEYSEKIKQLVKKDNLENYIEFKGSVPNKNVNKIYNESDLSVNLCPTGGMDKAVLESMASEVPALVLNKTFENLFGKYKNLLILNNEDEKELAEKIKHIMNVKSDEKNIIIRELKNAVIKNHNLEKLIINIIDYIK
ncbi:glycosyltransferase family 4 protein [Candidatus Parcubacteria bacterium]|nr:glycosyltransferase family 4 protein [Candidatus Parcubacteria bacterium]